MACNELSFWNCMWCGFSVTYFNLATGFLWTSSPELDLIQDRFSANFDPLSLSLYLRQVQSVLKSVGG